MANKEAIEVKEPAKVISFINMKGGVGKTTLTINIADHLAKEGYNVLILDMDPQFNATQSLLLHKVQLEKSGAEATVIKHDKHTEKHTKEIEKEIEDEVKSSEIYDEISQDKRTILNLFKQTSIVQNQRLIVQIKRNLDLVPGDLALSEEISGDTINKDTVLRQYIDNESLKDKYHYILIDCPPTWSVLTHASLFASDCYVIPSKVDFYSALGINLLQKQIKERLTEQYTYKQVGLELTNLGIIFTLVHRNIIAEDKRIAKIKEKTSKEIPFFETRIPHLPSVPTKLIVYSDSLSNANYRDLNNSIEKVTKELIAKTTKSKAGV